MRKLLPIILVILFVGASCSSSENRSTDRIDCDIKGNISSSGEKIYHLPGCASYSKTKIDASNGERWFCTEEDARDAGWRKAQNCY